MLLSRKVLGRWLHSVSHVRGSWQVLCKSPARACFDWRCRPTGSRKQEQTVGAATCDQGMEGVGGSMLARS